MAHNEDDVEEVSDVLEDLEADLLEEDSERLAPEDADGCSRCSEVGGEDLCCVDPHGAEHEYGVHEGVEEDEGHCGGLTSLIGGTCIDL